MQINEINFWNIFIINTLTFMLGHIESASSLSLSLDSAMVNKRRKAMPNSRPLFTTTESLFCPFLPINIPLLQPKSKWCFLALNTSDRLDAKLIVSLLISVVISQCGRWQHWKPVGSSMREVIVPPQPPFWSLWSPLGKSFSSRILQCRNTMFYLKTSFV